MAKDDYFVLAYKVLAYLYACLKAGESPSGEYLHYGTDKFPICESYWNYLIANLYRDGYITGVALVPIVGSADNGVKLLPNLQITPKGIEYLQENSMMRKAKEFLKEVKELLHGL